jgi:hypothetical protein
MLSGKGTFRELNQTMSQQIEFSDISLKVVSTHKITLNLT